MGVFALGFTTCIVSILRLHSLYVVSQTKDISWDNPMPAIWSSTELNVAVLCSCLPTLKGLISRIWPKLLSSGHTGQRSRGYHSHSLGHVSSGNGRQAAQHEWDRELKSPRLGQHTYINTPPARRHAQSPTFLETDSEHSLPSANRIYVSTDVAVQNNAAADSGQERDSTPTLTRGEDMRYMMRNPTYKV